MSRILKEIGFPECRCSELKEEKPVTGSPHELCSTIEIKRIYAVI
jgi:hypothetical protein